MYIIEIIYINDLEVWQNSKSKFAYDKIRFEGFHDGLLQSHINRPLIGLHNSKCPSVLANAKLCILSQCILTIHATRGREGGAGDPTLRVAASPPPPHSPPLLPSSSPLPHFSAPTGKMTYPSPSFLLTSFSSVTLCFSPPPSPSLHPPSHPSTHPTIHLSISSFSWSPNPTSSQQDSEEWLYMSHS